jgi:hypothetical protein
LNAIETRAQGPSVVEFLNFRNPKNY